MTIYKNNQSIILKSLTTTALAIIIHQNIGDHYGSNAMCILIDCNVYCNDDKGFCAGCVKWIRVPCVLQSLR